MVLVPMFYFFKVPINHCDIGTPYISKMSALMQRPDIRTSQVPDIDYWYQFKPVIELVLTSNWYNTSEET